MSRRRKTNRCLDARYEQDLEQHKAAITRANRQQISSPQIPPNTQPQETLPKGTLCPSKIYPLT